MADQAVEGLLSPYLRRQRVAAALPYLSGRILDYGCGSGALADFIPAERYLGIDVDTVTIAAARRNHPGHRFDIALPAAEPLFDTVVSLAVIEHVSDPAAFLNNLAARLHAGSGRIICTTPHPAMDWIHDFGARLGLFSSHASEEHEELLGRTQLAGLAQACGLRIEAYNRFLFGANQIVVFAPLGATP